MTGSSTTAISQDSLPGAWKSFPGLGSEDVNLSGFVARVPQNGLHPRLRKGDIIIVDPRPEKAEDCVNRLCLVFCAPEDVEIRSGLTYDLLWVAEESYLDENAKPALVSPTIERQEDVTRITPENRGRIHLVVAVLMPL